jgi:hypothetical protein
VVEVVLDGQPQPLALLREDVSEGHVVRRHPQRHEGVAEGRVGVEQGPVQVEHRESHAIWCPAMDLPKGVAA